MSRPETGRLHDWTRVVTISGREVVCCADCATIRNDRNAGAARCPGLVRVTVRTTTREREP